MAIQDFLRNNSQGLTQAGIGILSGRTPQEQFALGAQGFMQGQQANKTLAFLQQNAPEYAQAVQAGALTPSEAFKMATEARTQKVDPKANLMGVGGAIYDASTGQWITPPKQPGDGPKPTSLMIELEAAGLKPGTPEYNQALLNANKPKGMSIESDGQGGFRMVQGAGVDGMPPLNVEQGKNTGFLLRAQDANETISKLEDEGASLYNKAAQSIPGGLGNYMVGPNAQKLTQAKRDFINAVLRQESGAVISPEEFANAEQQYFPQPGDSQEVIAQKRMNRENAVRGFAIRSGPGAAAAQQPAQGGVVDYRDFFGGQ